MTSINHTSLPGEAISTDQLLAQSVETVLRMAALQCQQGQIDQAITLYKGILEIQPLNAEANHSLGILLANTQQISDGLAYLKNALLARSDHGTYWLDYIEALLQTGDITTAKKMLALGQQSGLQGEAVDRLLDRLKMNAIARDLTASDGDACPAAAGPTSPTKKRQPPGPKAKTKDRILRLLGSGRINEVKELSQSLVTSFPEHGFGWKILGVSLMLQDKHADAIQWLEHAVQLMPKDAECLYNLGTAFLECGRLDEAESNLRLSVALNQCDGLAHSNLGTVLHRQKKHAQAEVCFRRALALLPDNVKVIFSLGISLAAQGMVTEGLHHCKHAIELGIDFEFDYTSLLFLLSHDAGTTPEQLREAHALFGQQHETRLRSVWKPHNNDRNPSRPLHIGMVSGDLWNHAIATFLEPILDFLAGQADVVLHAYYTHTTNDAVTERLRQRFSKWNEVAKWTDEDLANKVRLDCIDILCDLSGHTTHHRLPMFARKPAPVQISWLGYPGTTGLKSMDYYVCDQFFVPLEIEWQFTEKMLRLPSSSSYLPLPGLDLPIATLPALKNQHFTFGSFNRINKIGEAPLALWSQLLMAVPTSKMMLAGLRPEGQFEIFRKLGEKRIPAERLIFHPRTNMRDYLALHDQVDLCLDTFPYSGGTTTCHAAWMGVPTLTLNGLTAPGRQSTCFMNQWGLQEFVADSPSDFIAKGVYWSQHTAALAEIRQSMRQRYDSSALSKPRLVGQHLLAAFRQAWRRWCLQLPPEPINLQIDEVSTTK